MSDKQLHLPRIGEINNIPEDFIPEPLKKGQIAVFQLLGGVPNPLPIGDPARTREVFYGKIVSIPTKDKVKFGGKIVDIGVPEEFDDKAVKRWKKFYFHADQNQGIFSFTGGNIQDEILYQYFHLSNLNQSNPNRDESITPMYYRVDPIAEAKDTIRKASVLGTALSFISNASDAEVRKIAASLAMDSTSDPQTIRAELIIRAQKDAQEFINKVEDPASERRALVKRAMDLGVISYSPVERKFVWKEGSTIATLDIQEGKDHFDAMADWLTTHTDGQPVKKKLEQLVAAALKNQSAKGPDTGGK